MKVKALRGEPLNEGADVLAEVGRTLEREGKHYRWKERTTRLVYSYDRNSHQWEKGTLSKTIRNAARRGAAESLMEERLQLGANKWQKGLFEKRYEDMEEDQMESEQNCNPVSPDKWAKIASGQWIQKEGDGRLAKGQNDLIESAQETPSNQC